MGQIFQQNILTPLCSVAIQYAHTVETGWSSHKVIIAQVKIEGIF